MISIQISKMANEGMRLAYGSTLKYELGDGIEFIIQNGHPLTPIETYNKINSREKPADKSIWINRKGVL